MRYLITVLMLFAGNLFYQGFTDNDWALAVMASYFQSVAAFTLWLQDKFLCQTSRQSK